MRKQTRPVRWAIVMGSLAWLLGTRATAQMPNVADLQSTFDTIEAPVLKVYSAEEDGHRFVAYLVKWNNCEVVVSDPLARSQFKEGDKITFIAQKISLPGSTINVSSLSFTLLDIIPEADVLSEPDGGTVSSADRKR